MTVGVHPALRGGGSWLVEESTTKVNADGLAAASFVSGVHVQRLRSVSLRNKILV